MHDHSPSKTMVDPWTIALEEGVRQMLDQPDILNTIGLDHIQNTPARVAKMYREIFWGCKVNPASVLTTCFPTEGDEMVSQYDMEFISHCAHHLLPFFGRAHFAYIPNGRIIGLSKIPRLIGVLAARPQVQEKLCAEIADEFMAAVNPKGVAVCLEAVHTCMFTRGVRKRAVTRTTALRGIFETQPHAKEEFLKPIVRMTV